MFPYKLATIPGEHPIEGVGIEEKDSGAQRAGAEQLARDAADHGLGVVMPLQQERDQALRYVAQHLRNPAAATLFKGCNISNTLIVFQHRTPYMSIKQAQTLHCIDAQTANSTVTSNHHTACAPCCEALSLHGHARAQELAAAVHAD